MTAPRTLTCEMAPRDVNRSKLDTLRLRLSSLSPEIVLPAVNDFSQDPRPIPSSDPLAGMRGFGAEDSE